MKKKQIKQLHSASVKELMSKLEKLEEELVILTNNLGVGKLKDVHQVKKIKRDIARIKTVLKEKSLQVVVATKKESVKKKDLNKKLSTKKEEK